MDVWAVAGEAGEFIPRFPAEGLRSRSLLWKEEVTTPFSSWQRSLLSTRASLSPFSEPVQAPRSRRLCRALAPQPLMSTPVHPFFQGHPIHGSPVSVSCRFGPLDAIVFELTVFSFSLVVRQKPTANHSSEKGSCSGFGMETLRASLLL